MPMVQMTDLEAALFRKFRDCDSVAQFRAVAHVMNEYDLSQERRQAEKPNREGKIIDFGKYTQKGG